MKTIFYWEAITISMLILCRKLRWQDDSNNSIERKKIVSQSPSSASESCVTGELVELHRDGSQVIELRRPKGKHFGFYVARGKVKNVNGECVNNIEFNLYVTLFS